MRIFNNGKLWGLQRANVNTTVMALHSLIQLHIVACRLKALLIEMSTLEKLDSVAHFANAQLLQLMVC
jgi:hypothetical protein